jgi:hypothetical protein
MWEFPEVCDASSNDRRLLLSPVVDSTEVGYSQIGCLLEYFSHGGEEVTPSRR